MAKNVGCIGPRTILVEAVTPGFHHEAVLYSEPDEYLAGTMPDIRETLDAGGSVLAAVGADRRELLGDALGGDAERVRFIDIEDPLAGRERAPDADGGGRGLWIVNHLCDLVQLRSSRAGSVVRLHMSV